MFAQSLTSDKRDSFLQLWNTTRLYQWGSFYRLVCAAKFLGVYVEDPFILVFQQAAHSVDEPIAQLKHFIRDAYRQLLLQRAISRRTDCSGPPLQVDVSFSRKLFMSIRQPLHKQMIRYFLTGAVDHSSQLLKPNLVSSPFCTYCNCEAETAKHIFWDCTSWKRTVILPL